MDRQWLTLFQNLSVSHQDQHRGIEPDEPHPIRYWLLTRPILCLSCARSRAAVSSLLQELWPSCPLSPHLSAPIVLLPHPPWRSLSFTKGVINVLFRAKHSAIPYSQFPKWLWAMYSLPFAWIWPQATSAASKGCGGTLNAWVPSITLPEETVMVVNTCDPRTREAETGGLSQI